MYKRHIHLWYTSNPTTVQIIQREKDTILVKLKLKNEFPERKRWSVFISPTMVDGIYSEWSKPSDFPHNKWYYESEEMGIFW